MAGFNAGNKSKLEIIVQLKVVMMLFAICNPYKGNETIVLEGYKWFGHNRLKIHKTAVRGLGGVKKSFFESHSVNILNQHLAYAIL